MSCFLRTAVNVCSTKVVPFSRELFNVCSKLFAPFNSYLYALGVPATASPATSSSAAPPVASV